MDVLDDLSCDLQLLKTFENAFGDSCEETVSTVTDTQKESSGSMLYLRKQLDQARRENKRLRVVNEHLCYEIGHLKDTIGKYQKSSEEISLLRKPFLHPPPEILHMIFQRTIPPTFLLDSATAPHPESSWCTSLRQMKALASVCRAWYKTGVRLLYEDICLRRIGQIPKLLRTLDQANYNLGGYVRKISLYSLIPEGYSNEFTHQMKQILDHCPRLSHFAVTSPCRLPLPDILPPINPTVTHLELGSAIQYTTLVIIASQLSSTLLSLSFHIPVIETGDWDCPDLVFPRMETLSCGLYPYRRKLLQNIEKSWSMPQLRRLTFKLIGNPVYWENIVNMDSVVSFCASYGPRLKYLSVHPEYWWSMSRYSINMHSLLETCPVLEHLVLHSKTLTPLSHPTVKWIDIWESHVRSDCIESWTTLRQNLMPEYFPALQGVRTLSSVLAYQHDLPTLVPPSCCITAADTFEFKFLGMHIRHEPGRLRCLEAPWSEESDDDEDENYVDCPEDDLAEWDFGDSDSSSEAVSASSDDESPDDLYIKKDWDADPDMLSNIYFQISDVLD